MELKYNIPQIKAAATTCDALASNINYDKSKLIDANSTNSGTVKTQIDNIISDLSMCAQNTKTYMTNSSTFISKMAKYLEDMDQDLARKVAES